MKNEIKKKIKKCVSLEIAIEYKSCLYFSCILFFYFVYLLLQKVYYASVVNMFEMILTAYFAGYIQVYFFDNFDEAEQIEKKTALGMIFCTCLYGGASYLFNWYGRGLGATVLFLIYMLAVYLCVYLCNKVKRIVDTENLNRMLAEFKKKDEEYGGQGG